MINNINDSYYYNLKILSKFQIAGRRIIWEIIWKHYLNNFSQIQYSIPVFTCGVYLLSGFMFGSETSWIWSKTANYSIATFVYPVLCKKLRDKSERTFLLFLISFFHYDTFRSIKNEDMSWKFCLCFWASSWSDYDISYTTYVLYNSATFLRIKLARFRVCLLPLGLLT